MKPGFPVCCHIQDARNVRGRHPNMPLYTALPKVAKQRGQDTRFGPPHLVDKHKNALTGAFQSRLLRD